MNPKDHYKGGWIWLFLPQFSLLHFGLLLPEHYRNVCHGNTKQQSIPERCFLCVRLEWVKVINTQLYIMCCFRRKFLFPIPMVEFRLFLLIWFLTFRGEMESEQNSRIPAAQNSCFLLKVEHKAPDLTHPKKYTKEREGLEEGTQKNTWKVTKTSQGIATTIAQPSVHSDLFLVSKSIRSSKLCFAGSSALLPSVCLRQLLVWPVCWDLDQNIKEVCLYILRCACLKVEPPLPFFPPH